MASLVDTNILVYRLDGRFPEKREIANRVLTDGLAAGELVLPHQAIVEFVSAASKPRRDLDFQPLLTRSEALAEAEALALAFPVLYPDRRVLTTAIFGAAAYQLSWFDAHLWAYAEVNGCDEILTEDFEHGRHYGSVRTVDPFLAASGTVAELPSLYDTS